MMHVILFKDTGIFRRVNTLLEKFIDALWTYLSFAIGLHVTRTGQGYPQRASKIEGFFNIVKNDRTLLAMFCGLIVLGIVIICIVRIIALSFL